MSLTIFQKRSAQNGAMVGLPSSISVPDYGSDNFIICQTQLSWLSLLIELMRLMLPVTTTKRMTTTTLTKLDYSIECHPLLVLPFRKLLVVREIKSDSFMASMSMQVVLKSENLSLLAIPTAHAAFESGLLVIWVIIFIITIQRLGWLELFG